MHIKIKQDLEGLMGSMKNILVGTKKQGSTLGLNLPPLIVPKQSSTPFKLQMPALPTLPQAPGKPPVRTRFDCFLKNWPIKFSSSISCLVGNRIRIYLDTVSAKKVRLKEASY